MTAVVPAAVRVSPSPTANIDTELLPRSVTGSQSVAGFHVYVEYEKLESGSWVLKDKPQMTLDANGNYTDSGGVGVGS